MIAGSNAMLVVLACASAVGAGWCAWLLYLDRAERARRKKAIALSAAQRTGSSGSDARGTAKERVIASALGLSHRIDLGSARCFLPQRGKPPPRFARQVTLAGLRDELTYVGYRESRLRLLVGGCAAGALVGCPFSFELSAVMMCAGAAAGWRALPAALDERIALRARDLERCLPEMLDVLAMGMRSGLSFDGSLALYERYFDTLLARAFRSAQQQWSCGLVRRDEALRAIASTYDSFLFKRVVDNILRSLRFGTSLTESLEDVAREARADYKARRQEQVAKAPIKMMLPTGALMLPAMLILVLGPVLLELAGSLS